MNIHSLFGPLPQFKKKKEIVLKPTQYRYKNKKTANYPSCIIKPVQTFTCVFRLQDWQHMGAPHEAPPPLTCTFGLRLHCVCSRHACQTLAFKLWPGIFVQHLAWCKHYAICIQMQMSKLMRCYRAFPMCENTPNLRACLTSLWCCDERLMP